MVLCLFHPEPSVVLVIRRMLRITAERGNQKKNFLSFAEIARHEDEDYYIFGADELFTDGKLGDPLDREIIDITLFDADAGAYVELFESQNGKPFYVPKKAVLLRYANEFYHEPPLQAKAIRSYLQSN